RHLGFCVGPIACRRCRLQCCLTIEPNERSSLDKVATTGLRQRPARGVEACPVGTPSRSWRLRVLPFRPQASAPFFGGDRGMCPGRNTVVSAIAILDGAPTSPLGLRVIWWLLDRHHC